MSKGKNYQQYYNSHDAKGEANDVFESQAEEIKETVEVAAEQPVEKERKETTEVKQAVVVNANLVNVRKSPAEGSEIIDVVRKGTVVDLGETDVISKDWKHIKYGNITGFMMSKFLKEIDAANVSNN